MDKERLQAELADRLLEQSLGETLGGKAPPDLSQQIAAAAAREGLEATGQGAPPSALRVVGSAASHDAQAARRMGQPPRWPLWRTLSAAAALLLATGLGYWVGNHRPPETRLVASEEIEVFFARSDLPAGTIVAAEHLTSRRIPKEAAPLRVARLEDLLGQEVQRELLAGDVLDPRRLGRYEPPQAVPLTQGDPGGHLAVQPPPATMIREQETLTGSAPVRVLVGSEQRWVFPPPSFEATLLSRNGAPRTPGSELVEHAFYATGERPVAKVPIHAHEHSWRQVHKLLAAGGLPAADEVRLADFLNYFDTPIAGDAGEFTSLIEVGACPWEKSHRLLRAVVRSPGDEKHAQLHVEFNPAEVSMWRLLGHEHRQTTAPGASLYEGSMLEQGQQLVALFEIVPAGGWTMDAATAAPLKFQSPPALTAAAQSGEVCALRLRLGFGDGPSIWKEPKLLPARSDERSHAELKLAGAVASFALLLRGSLYAGEVTYANVELMVEELDLPELGERQDELLAAVRQARKLAQPAPSITIPPE